MLHLLSTEVFMTYLCPDSMYPCFAVSGDQTANQLRDRFQPTLTHSLVGDHVNRLIDSSLGSHWTRLYDSVSHLPTVTSNTDLTAASSTNITHSPYYNDHRTCRIRRTFAFTQFITVPRVVASHSDIMGLKYVKTRT